MVIDLDKLTVDCPNCQVGQKDCGLCDMTGHVSVSRGIELRNAMSAELWGALSWLISEALVREIARLTGVYAFPAEPDETRTPAKVTVQ